MQGTFIYCGCEFFRLLCFLVPPCYYLRFIISVTRFSACPPLPWVTINTFLKLGCLTCGYSCTRIYRLLVPHHLLNIKLSLALSSFAQFFGPSPPSTHPTPHLLPFLLGGGGVEFSVVVEWRWTNGRVWYGSCVQTGEPFANKTEHYEQEVQLHGERLLARISTAACLHALAGYFFIVWGFFFSFLSLSFFLLLSFFPCSTHWSALFNPASLGQKVPSCM